MSFKITADCKNCGACEPECPNTAITAGADVFEIHAEKCTECVGFHGQPQCAAVCPVDSCVVDPANAETDAVLFARAKVLHPNKDFGATYPSRFKK